MNQEKYQIQLSPRALVRYQLVSELEAHLLGGRSLPEALEAVLSRPHRDAEGAPIKLSTRSLRRWLEAYRREGLGGLESKGRPRIASSKVLSEELLELVRLEKKRDPLLSVPQLIELARLRGVLSDGQKISRTTLWRACRRMGLPLRRPQRAEQGMRRFGYPNRMLMVLCDGKHFRAGASRARRVALHFLDDATRMGLGVIVGTSETTELFLQGLYRLIRNHGLMRALYLDHGPGFISDDTHAVLGHLGIRLIHGSVAYPQGHGKVERFHRTASEQLLRTLDGNPEVDSDCASLTLRLSHWLRELYNHSPHESLGRESPSERWLSDLRELEFPAEEAWLSSAFTTNLVRRVSSDNVISYEGTLYEVPRGHAREKLCIVRHLLEPGVLSILHEGRLVRLHRLDPHQNAYSRRARPSHAPQELSPGTSAAHIAFEEALGPIVDSDGGFPKTEEDLEK